MSTKRKKTMTKKQIEANRANAKKSTGPKTPEGKLRSALNATTHGLTAKALVRENDPEERIEDFITLHVELQADLRPVGRNEEALVQRIAVCHWRLNRAYRFENNSVASARQTEPVAQARVSSQRPHEGPKRSRADDVPSSNRKSEIENRQFILPVLPDAPDLERLIRYESLIDRELNRTMAHLKSLRAERLRQSQCEDDDGPQDMAEALEMANTLSHLAGLQPIAPTSVAVAPRGDREGESRSPRRSPAEPGKPQAKPAADKPNPFKDAFNRKSEIANRKSSPSPAPSPSEDKSNPSDPPNDSDDAPKPPTPRRRWMPPAG